MSPHVRRAAWPVLAAAVVVAVWAWRTGLLWPEPSLARTPEALARGRAVLEARCLGCHATIPLAPRVEGWSVEYAYDAIARLQDLRPEMPRFQGSIQERADLAIFLAALGSGEAPPPEPRPPR